MPFDGIGIATAGQVNRKDGSILYANPNIPDYTGFPLRSELIRYFGVPAALGEPRFGAGRPFECFLCLTYGTGIGGAIVINRTLERGADGAAGEFRIFLTHCDRSAEGDILSGCYESYASTAALVRAAVAYDLTLDSGRAIFARLREKEVVDLMQLWQASGL